WVERWHDATRTERRDADDTELHLHERFAERLEADFRRHHDAAHYAAALAVPAAALSRALSHVTGRATKELITDRVMLEAARCCASPTSRSRRSATAPGSATRCTSRARS